MTWRDGADSPGSIQRRGKNGVFLLVIEECVEEEYFLLRYMSYKSLRSTGCVRKTFLSVGLQRRQWVFSLHTFINSAI